MEWAWLKAETNRRVVSHVRKKSNGAWKRPLQLLKPILISMRPQSHDNNDYKLLGSKPGNPQHECTCMEEKQIKRFRQNYPLPSWRLFNLSLDTRHWSCPNKTKVTSEKLILLLWVKDFRGDECLVSARLKGSFPLAILSHTGQEGRRHPPPALCGFPNRRCYGPPTCTQECAFFGS